MTNLALPCEPEVRIARVSDDVAVVALLGEHDMATAWEVRNALALALDQGAHLVVDLSQAELIDSSIIHALFESEQLASDHGRRVSLQLQAHAGVNRVLELCGVLAALPVYRTHAEAIDAVRQGARLRDEARDDQVIAEHSQPVNGEHSYRRGLREIVKANPL